MTPTILRSVLIISMMVGIGIVLNIFSSQQQSATGRGNGSIIGQPVSAERKLANARRDQKTDAKLLQSAVRRELENRGYLTASSGASTGVSTAAAILAFEFDHNLKLTAMPTDAILKALIFTHTTAGKSRQIRPQTEAARELVGEVQRALAHLGYGQPNITTELDGATRKAIRKFERARGLQVSGRVSAPLIASLGPAFDATKVGHASDTADPNAG